MTKVKTSLLSPSNKVVFKKKIGRKMQAVNNSGKIIKVAATKSQLKRAGLPQRVQSKSMMKEGYINRSRDSIGAKNGKASSKKISLSGRLKMRGGEQKKYNNSPFFLY